MKSRLPQLVMQLRVNQVDLPEVGPLGVPGCKRPVLDCSSLVRVTLDAQAGEQANTALVRLCDRMRRAAAHCRHDSRSTVHAAPPRLQLSVGHHQP